MRLQRALARAGVASRRAAEELIEQGKVRVDGAVATLGMKVDPDRQRITVSGRAVKPLARRWLAFHKPMGVVTTADDEEGHRLTHPRYHIPRRYTALVHGRPTAEIAQAVRQRVMVDGRPVVTSEVRVRPGSEGRSILDVTLTEGRNRIVRRWAEAMGLRVDRLARLSYGPVRLGDLAPGRYRPLTPREEAGLYKAV